VDALFKLIFPPLTNAPRFLPMAYKRAVSSFGTSSKPYRSISASQ